MAGYDLEREIISMLKRDEGFSATPYKDTEGLLTIGFGFCLDRVTMPEKVAEVWLVELIKEKSAWLANSHINNIYRELNTARKAAILNMCYQLGVRGCLNFKEMWLCLEDHDYEGSAREALNSHWANQTPGRAARVAEVIRTGSTDEYWN